MVSVYFNHQESFDSEHFVALDESPSFPSHLSEGNQEQSSSNTVTNSFYDNDMEESGKSWAVLNVNFISVHKSLYLTFYSRKRHTFEMNQCLCFGCYMSFEEKMDLN